MSSPSDKAMSRYSHEEAATGVFQRQGLQETAWARVIELGNLLVHRGQRGTLRLESPGQPVEQRDPVQQVERAREHAPLVTGEEQQRQGGESEEGAGQERYDDR